jgi:hypothetical protein
VDGKKRNVEKQYKIKNNMGIENELKKDFEIKHWKNYMDYVQSLPIVELTEEMKKDIEERLKIAYNPINLDSAASNT